MELRNYQQKAIDDVITAIKNNKKLKTVVVQPCGAGKSLIIAKLCEIIETPILVLQPSKELLEQNYGKFVMFGGEAAIFSASVGSKEIGNVTYATPMSITKTGKEFKKLGVKTVIVDECDAGTKTDGAIAKLIKQINPNYLIGLTATPINLHTNLESGTTIRMINDYHKNIFNDICHITQTKDIVEQGFWSKIIIERVNQNESSLKVNTQGTDYTVESTIKYYEDNALEEQILKQFDKGLKEGRKHCLISVPTVAEGDSLAKKDKRIKVVSAYTSKEEREQILQDFKTGKVKGVANVMAVSVGFDFPELDFMIMARPTASYRIYYQTYGRGVRIHKNKKDCLLVDLTPNTEKFGRPEEMTYEYLEGYGWGMFLGEYLMTKVNLKNGLKVKKEHLFKKEEDCEVDSFWFGKYKGKKISEVPHTYIDWMLNEMDFSWVKDKKKVENFKSACLVQLGKTPEKDTQKTNWGKHKKTSTKKDKNLLW